MASKTQSWKELSRHQAPKNASISHASWTVLGEAFTNFEPILPSIYDLPLDSESQFNTERGEFTCDKHYFLLISVQRLSSLYNEAKQKIYLEFTNASIAGQNYSVRCDINEFFGDYSDCLGEENTSFDIKNHEEYNMTKSFIANVMLDQIPKRKPKIALGKLRLLIPRANKDRLTRCQWRAYNWKDGIFTKYYYVETFKEFCKEKQREYDEAKAKAEEIDENDYYNASSKAFAKMFKVLKGTKIRLVLEQSKNRKVKNSVANNSINDNKNVVLWSLAVVQEAFVSENDVAKFKLKKSFMNCHQPYCCFKCGKRVETASGFVQHFKTHETENATMNSQKKMKTIPCSISVCTKKFSNEAAMKEHIKFYRHSKCAKCNKRVKNELALQMHFIVKHGGGYASNPYIHHRQKRHYYAHSRTGKVCNICREPFPQPDDKLRHMNDYKHYQCTVCRKSFMTEGNLQRHVRSKHPIYYEQHLHEAPNKKAKRLAHMTKADVDD